MNTAFYKLSEEKQKQIINAALVEFTQEGYEKASTNTIIVNAEISKGLLFYYFQSKQGLFEFLIESCLEFIENNYLPKLDFAEPDFIKRYQGLAIVKMKAMQENPHCFNFLASLYLDNYTSVPDRYTKRIIKMMQKSTSALYENVDNEKFRSDVAIDKLMKFVSWSLEGYQNEITARLKGKKLTEIDYTPYWEEFDEYVRALEKLIYKNSKDEEDTNGFKSE